MRVLLADNHATVRSALRLLLEHEDDIEIVGEVEERGDLLKVVIACRPDILLIDWALALAQPADLKAELHRQQPHLGIVVLSSRPEARQEAEQAGLAHFVSKSAFSEELLAVVRAVHATGLPAAK